MKPQLLLVLFVSIHLYTYGQDAHPVGNAKELAEKWKVGSRAQARQESSSSLILPLDKGKSLETQRNYTKVDSAATHLIGEVPNQPGSNVYLKITKGERIEGQVLIPNRREAYEYFTKGEEVFVKSVDIDRKLCVQYIPPPGAVSPPVVPKSNDNSSQRDSALKLQSLLGATSVVLLDFDGEYVNCPFWNGGNPIDAQSFGFHPSLIKEMWESVSEDYRMFNVNITTDENVFNAAPIGQRVRCIITPTDAAAPGYGGVAHVGSFNWDSDVPCFVFISIYNYAAEAASHEIGHTLGLSHDGRTIPKEEYYQGQGSWAPIMGVSYYGYVTQWSRGEYANANNLEDDLAIMAISVKEGGYRTDDHGDSPSSSTLLEINDKNVILSEVNRGIIGRPNDKDVFRFSLTSASYVSLTLSPNPKFPNLNIAASLVDAQGIEVANLDPGGLAVYYDDYLAAGLYYLTIKGNGDGDVLTDGYSDYASFGTYSISGYVSTCTGNYEPNQYFETAAPISSNSIIQASISYAIDQDFYKISFNKPENIVVSLNNLAVNLDLSLYDGNGQLISTSQNNGSVAEKIQFFALQGDYIIKVNGRDGANSLSCYELSCSTVNSYAEAYEPNNELQSAPIVPLNFTIMANINSNQDLDYYKLEIPKAGRLDLVLDSLDQNYDLRFYNSSGQQLAAAVFKGAEKGNLSYSILNEGTYYLRVASDNVLSNDQCYKLSNAFSPSISSLALKFNGDNTGALLPVNSKLDLGLNDFTIEIFVQLDQGVGSRPAKTENLINNTNTPTKNYAHLYLRRGAASVTLDTLTFSSGNVYLKAKKNLKDGRCHHVVIAKKDKMAFLYIDGKEEARSATSLIGGTGNSTSAWVIGAINAKYQNYTSFMNAFKGSIKELRVWNIAHSQEEIKRSLNNGLLGTEKGLIGYWPFNEGGGSVIKDNCKNPVLGIIGATIYSPSWVYNTCTSITISDAFVVAGMEESHTSESSGVSVYPNPFNEEFTFAVNGARTETYLLELTTPAGEIVYKQEVAQPGIPYSTNSQLSSGYYLLKLTNASGTYVKPVVKR